MSEMFTTYEYVVAQKAEGRFLVRKILFLLLYVVYIVSLLLVGVITRIGIPLLALVPVTTWILVFFTWRYAKVEYEYSLTSGQLTFSEIYGGRSRKKKMEMRLRDAVHIRPRDEKMTESLADAYAPEEVYHAVPSRDARDVYVMLYANEAGKHCAFCFVATEQALKIMKYYNAGATVVRPTER